MRGRSSKLGDELCSGEGMDRFGIGDFHGDFLGVLRELVVVMMVLRDMMARQTTGKNMEFREWMRLTGPFQTPTSKKDNRGDEIKGMPECCVGELTVGHSVNENHVAVVA